MIFSAIISRTIGPGVGGPAPQQCDTIKLRWSNSVSRAGMRLDASFPNPVLIP
jgi:hypothetical protein